jgi:hypothetical protein
LVQALSAQGQEVKQQAFSGSEDERRAAVLSALSEFLADELVYIAGPLDDSADVLDTQKQRCLTGIHLTQALETNRHATPCHVTFVTRGAFPTANGVWGA